MPNVIDANGLQVATRDELITNYTANYELLYGPDINLDPDTPDGQEMNINAQAVLDLEDLVVQVYNMFDPDLAIGKVLDQRVAINGIQRQAGTFTVTNLTVVTNQALNLYGLDQTVQQVFTYSDNAGNAWNLIATQLGVAAGTNIFQFQSAVPGAVLTVPNTINVPVTIVLGVVSVNNPTTYTTLGINEETDAALRIRRQKSVSLSSQGYLAGLLAALENISGVTSAFVYENDTDTTDGDGIPSHSIWVIVAGSGSNAAIAQAIYSKRNAGCGMKGSQTFNILQADGTIFTVRWDIVTQQDLFIKFVASSLDGVNDPNIVAIRSDLVLSFVPQVDQKVNINTLSTDVQAIDPNTLVTSAGFSTTSGGSYTTTLTPSTKDKQFDVQAANIIITPMIMSPKAVTLVHGSGQQFVGLGGFGTLTYSMHTNASGGSVNSSTGLYTSGATSGTDVVRVTDSLSNIADATITVT